MVQKKLRDLLKLSIHTALNAGKEILKVYETDDFEIEVKSDNSPLTRADKLSNQVIIQELADTISETGKPIPVLSEEGKNIPYEKRKDWSLFWLVDPLDGTKEFIKRNGEFTVNIALLENNEPILGVIYAPAFNGNNEDLDNRVNLSLTGKEVADESKWLEECLKDIDSFPGEIYFAAENEGAFKYSKNSLIKLDINSYSLNSDNKLTAVSSRSHSSEEEKKKLEELGIKDFVSVGSSLKFCLVAGGKAQVYFRNGPTMEWDVGAGYSIAKEAGAVVKGLTFNKENLLNSSFSVTRN